MPATDWHQVRKDAGGQTEVAKTVTSDSVADAGKAPPGNIAGREFPGQRVKVPPIDDTADTTQELALPRKASVVDEDIKACACSDVKKCACGGNKIKEAMPAGAGKPSCKCEVDKCNCNTIKDEEEAKKAEPPAAEVEKAIEPYKQPSTPGVMLALIPPPEVAAKLRQDGGMEPDDMHVTLGYYGKLGEHITQEQLDGMKKCVAKACQGYKPFKAAIGGLGRFTATASSDGKDVLVGLVDSPELHDLREDLLKAVQKSSTVTKDGEEPAPSGPTHFKNHGYTPHITLGYIDVGDPLAVHKLDRDEFTFTQLVLQVGKDKTVYTLGEAHNVAKSIWMPIVKSDTDQRLATGIVLQPEETDAQGDIISIEVIRQAAHNFLAAYNKKTQLGLQHEMMKPDGVELVESWIAPVDMILNTRTIKAGTWMMTVRVNNDEIWTKIKTGQLGGFSIGGLARVQRLAA